MCLVCTARADEDGVRRELSVRVNPGAGRAACVGTLTADMQGMPCGERAATFG